jgi:predicted nucleic acid-binding protein
VLGALAREHACVVATLDRDFARFASVRHLLVSSEPAHG